MDYDVKVGEGRDYSTLPEDKFSEDLKYLSKKRIDVVGFRGDEIFVIELKPKADLRAIGEAFGYASLYREIGPADKRIQPVVITDEILPDIQNVCSKMGVLIFKA